MAIIDLELIKEKLRKKVPPELYDHSIRTAEVAVRMAEVFGVDKNKANLAGLLHDYAKSMDGDNLIQLATRMGIEVNPVEMSVPYLLHASVGARLVEEDVGIKDKEIIQSIANHTIGSPAMTKLDKIIYVADMIEPGRPYKGLDPLRRMALDDLDKVFLEAYAHSLDYLIRSKKPIHPLTVEIWNKLVLSQDA
ncbi:MAG: bis(5'-nucleosyl)-tetraphosphatase (symmetrical) YqeK [Actinomycetota bacterium]|nr:bis(5'-nucleosyl)-tetraphosphatase (symmetrical) YqeK [Actinomycetota bacterium]